ncbi:MAG: pilus assembly protein TadG-related protein [Hyphomicrobiales bacterium]
MRALRRLLFQVTRRGERGNIMVMFAAGLAGFLGLTGLSVDVGQLVYTRTDLQKTADAAALAAALDLPDQDAARATAQSYVHKNGGSSTWADVTFATEGNSITVRVVAKRHVKYTFLRAVGLSGADSSAKAAVRSDVVTGYAFDDTDVFPYAVWGGNPNPPAGCPYGICVGSIQTYRDNAYRNQVEPNYNRNPNWDENSNTFKGYFHHGTGIVQINPNEWQTFSNGGNSNGEAPIGALHEHYLSHEPIIVPVIGAVRDCNGNTGINCPGGDIQFKIVAWVALELTVDPQTAPSSWAWQGKVIGNYSTAKGALDGQYSPPSQYATRTNTMVE